MAAHVMGRNSVGVKAGRTSGHSFSFFCPAAGPRSALLNSITTMHGQFVWYELLTPDTDAAKKFYSSVTGWGTQPFDNDYSMWTTAGAPFAGLYRLGPEMRQQGVPPNWMPYVESSNVDETVRLATTLGGK